MAECAFCEIIAGNAPAKFVNRNADASAFVPLNPVVEGHVLVVPHRHARYIWELDSSSLAMAVAMAAQLATNIACNVIQSNGVAATQTVPHVHFHIVPRSGGDGLMLPWTGQTEGAVPSTPEGPCD